METITKYTVPEILEKWSSQTGIKMTQAALADKLGISKQQIGQLKNKPIPIKYNSKIESFIKDVKKEGITLDFYPDVQASCGKGNYIDTETKEQIVVPLQAVPNYSVHNKYTVIKAQSDSMLPEIKPNDCLVVQHNIENIIDNHIYIFSFNGELFCKYLSNNLGQIIVRSANKDYPIRYIEGEALDNFQLIGEVKAQIREYKI